MNGGNELSINATITSCKSWLGFIKNKLQVNEEKLTNVKK